MMKKTKEESLTLYPRQIYRMTEKRKTPIFGAVAIVPETGG
jgi:hypothetical protein